MKTIVYMKVSLSDFLTLFAARTRGPFWSMRPGNKVPPLPAPPNPSNAPPRYLYPITF